jgi:BirA family biotin operon repressor/biotin-[acetyl-CoA-carboxylase] ligase
MNGKKICGILTEASLSMETGSPDYIIIGIGIDVRSAGDEMESLKDIASSIEDETGIKADRNILCAAVLDSLDEYMTASKPFLDEYRQREILTGHNVTVISGKTEFTGKVIGIDDNAALMIEMTDGTVKTVGSGEATIKK